MSQRIAEAVFAALTKAIPDLLFAAPAGFVTDATCIGTFSPGSGISLNDAGTPVPLPTSLGYEHAPRA